MNLVRVLPVLIAAVVLSACSSVHPGAAAVVDGSNISMNEVDTRAETMCVVQQATAQQAAPADNAAIRRNAAATLVLDKIADSVVADRDLTVDQSLATLPAETRAQIVEIFDDRADDVMAVLAEQQQMYAKFVAVGADATGQIPAPENYDALASAGQQEIQAQAAEHDVEFAPRLGIAADGTARPGFGSVSVAPAEVANDTAPASALSACTL